MHKASSNAKESLFQASAITAQNNNYEKLMKLFIKKTFIFFLLFLNRNMLASSSSNKVHTSIQQNTKRSAEPQTTPDWMQTLKILEPFNQNKKQIVASRPQKTVVKT